MARTRCRQRYRSTPASDKRTRRCAASLHLSSGPSPEQMPQAPRQTAARAAPLQSIKINTRPGERRRLGHHAPPERGQQIGPLRTLRHKRFHEDAREKKKRKVAEARRKMKFMRQRKRRSQQQGPVDVDGGGRVRGGGACLYLCHGTHQTPRSGGGPPRLARTRSGLEWTLHAIAPCERLRIPASQRSTRSSLSYHRSVEAKV